jgi:SAM-dependent methyltransferase
LHREQKPRDPGYEALNLGQPESEHDPFTEERYRQFYRFLPVGTRTILDIGCNTGRGGGVLKALDKNLRLHGMDAVRDRLDQLPEGVYEVGVHGHSTEIPSSDGTYDAVVAGEFLEHVYDRDVGPTLGEIFRVLKVGGRVLLTTPNPSDIKRRLRGTSILGGAHVSQHFPDALTLRLRLAGFSRTRIYGSGKVSRYLGSRLPLLLYGSYLASGDKF